MSIARRIKTIRERKLRARRLVRVYDYLEARLMRPSAISHSEKIMRAKADPVDALRRRFAGAMAAACVVLVAGCAAPAYTVTAPQPLAANSPAPMMQKATAAAVAPRQAFLVWDGDNIDGFTVETGPSRGNYTNKVTVFENRISYNSKLAYRVSNAGGSALWPMKRIERLVFEVYETVDGKKVGEMPWIQYTNSVEGAEQKFVRLRQELVGEY